MSCESRLRGFATGFGVQIFLAKEALSVVVDFAGEQESEFVRFAGRQQSTEIDTVNGIGTPPRRDISIDADHPDVDGLFGRGQRGEAQVLDLLPDEVFLSFVWRLERSARITDRSRQEDSDDVEIRRVNGDRRRAVPHVQVDPNVTTKTRVVPRYDRNHCQLILTWSDVTGVDRW